MPPLSVNSVSTGYAGNRSFITDLFNGFNRVTGDSYTGGPTTVADNIGSLITPPANMMGIEGGRLSYNLAEGATLGPELFTDPGFNSPVAWTTTDASISVSGGQLLFNGTVAGKYASQEAILTIGKTYRCSFNILAISGGNLKLSALGGISKADTGEYVRIGVASITAARILVGGTVTATIDNASIREVIPVWVPYGVGVNTKCVGIGDSLTAGNARNDSWIPTTLDINTWQTITDKGVAGNTLTQMSARWNADVLALAPTVVVIEGGINDVAQAAVSPVEGMKTLLQGMVESAVANNIRPVVANLPPFGNNASWTAQRQVWHEEYNNWLLSYCEANGVALVDMYNTLRDGVNLAPLYDPGDGLHPNTDGNKALAVVFAAAMPYGSGPPIASSQPARTRRGVVAKYASTFKGFLIDPVKTPVYQRPTAGRLRPNNFGVWVRVLPTGTGQTGVIWSTRVDANNYAQISATATAITFSKTIAGVTTSATVNYTHTAGAFFEVQASQSSTAGMVVGVKQDGGALTVLGTNASTSDCPIGATYHEGSLNGASHFAGNYPFVATVMHPDPRTYLEAIATRYP